VAVLTPLFVLLTGCGLRDVMPGPPVMGAKERLEYDGAGPAAASNGAPIVYTGAPMVDFPVLPLQVWGLRYALDVVLVSDHPDWVMHEYARIDLPDRTLWMAKDAGRDREQTITTDLPDLASWVAEVPVRRHPGALTVTDHSTATTADLRFQYVNPLGQPVDVAYTGPLPTAPSNPRNGNTMGHSRGTVAALLDLYLFRIGGRAVVDIAGPRKLHNLLGLVPEAYLLAQVQAGVAVTDLCEHPDGAGGFTVERPCKAEDWPTRATEAWTVQGRSASRAGPVVSLDYHFAEGGLDRATAVQAGSDTPLAVLTFAPALPDIRRPFVGEAFSRFVVDVDGQVGHGEGCVKTRWAAGAVQVDFLPTAPRWFANRPIRTTISYLPDADGTLTPWVHAERRDDLLEPACGPSLTAPSPPASSSAPENTPPSG